METTETPPKKPYDVYHEWVQFERNGFWHNLKTGEESVFHPVALSIGGKLYDKASTWCKKAALDHNRKA